MNGEKMDIQLFIFDLDGVITDTAEYHFLAWKALADKFNLKFDREMNEKLRGVSRIESLNIIIEVNNMNISEETKNEWATLKNDLYVELINEITPKDLLTGVKELLEDLKNRKIKIALGSASKNARTVIEKLGIAEYFDVIGDGFSVENSKPAPDIFLHVAEELNINPENCIVVEDAEAGIDAAISAGMKTIGIGPKERLGKADYIYSSIEEIKLKSLL